MTEPATRSGPTDPRGISRVFPDLDEDLLLNLFHKGAKAQWTSRDLDFGPGVESLDVRLFDESAIPWEELAFRTIARTLRNWFLDRKGGSFPLRVSALERRSPPPPNLTGAA